MLAATDEADSRFMVYVKLTTGMSRRYQARYSDTVADLKAQVQEVEKVGEQDQRLLYNAVIMEDSRSLDSYKMPNGAVVSLVPRLRAAEKAGTMKAASARRGLLMVPGHPETWRPQASSRLTAKDVDEFFDSNRMPALWESVPAAQ
mmetsp:Transcript_43411/g.100047  ORF Transcript_43411/g.100047 Transcript_43411/m.100047 type:complete len:146 (+) Transcript_43411:58-495(+)